MDSYELDLDRLVQWTTLALTVVGIYVAPTYALRVQEESRCLAGANPRPCACSWAMAEIWHVEGRRVPRWRMLLESLS